MHRGGLASFPARLPISVDPPRFLLASPQLFGWSAWVGKLLTLVAGAPFGILALMFLFLALGDRKENSPKKNQLLSIRRTPEIHGEQGGKEAQKGKEDQRHEKTQGNSKNGKERKIGAFMLLTSAMAKCKILLDSLETLQLLGAWRQRTLLQRCCSCWLPPSSRNIRPQDSAAQVHSQAASPLHVQLEDLFGGCIV